MFGSSQKIVRLHLIKVFVLVLADGGGGVLPCYHGVLISRMSGTMPPWSEEVLDGAGVVG